MWVFGLLLLVFGLLLHTTTASRAIFWEHGGEKGSDFYCHGCTVPKVPMNDEISTIEIQGNCRVTVYEDYNFGGASRVFEGSQSTDNLGWWNDRISSLIAVCDGNSHGDVIYKKKGNWWHDVKRELGAVGDRISRGWKNMDLLTTAECTTKWGGVLACIIGGGGPACIQGIPTSEPCYQYLKDEL